MSWRRGQTATYWPKLLLTIAAPLSHPGRATQPWVTEGPKPPVCRSLSVRHLVPNWNWNWPTQAVCGTWSYNCLTFTCFQWAYASARYSTTSTSQGYIPICSTGYTCFAVLPLIYTGGSHDWRLGRGSICDIIFHSLELFTSAIADGFSLKLSDSKSPQVSWILAVLNNAVVWMVSTRPPTSKSSSPFNNPLVTVPNSPITIGIIVTCMFNCFSSSLILLLLLLLLSHFLWALPISYC